MQPTYYLIGRNIGGGVYCADQATKDFAMRCGDQVLLFAERLARGARGTERDYYEPILAHGKGMNLDGRQKLQPEDVLILAQNLEGRSFSGVYLYPVVNTHTGILRFQPSPIDTANSVRYHINLKPNERLIFPRSDDGREVLQLCKNVMAFRDNPGSRKHGGTLREVFVPHATWGERKQARVDAMRQRTREAQVGFVMATQP